MSNKVGDCMGRNKFTPNEIVLLDEYAELILYDKNNIECARSKIDLEEVDRVSKYKWNYTNGYVRNVKKGMFLHNFILNRTPNKVDVVDHINRDRCDNRKHNLRVVDYTINGFNKGKQSNNTSGHVGVSWEKSRGKWEVHIKRNRKKIFLGYFENLEDAVKRRKQAELEFYNELRNEEHDINTFFK